MLEVKETAAFLEPLIQKLSKELHQQFICSVVMEMFTLLFSLSLNFKEDHQIKPLIFSSKYPSRVLWCESPHSWDISWRDVCLNLKKGELINVTFPQRSKKIYIKEKKKTFSSTKHDLASENNNTNKPSYPCTTSLISVPPPVTRARDGMQILNCNAS